MHATVAFEGHSQHTVKFVFTVWNSLFEAGSGSCVLCILGRSVENILYAYKNPMMFSVQYLQQS